MQLLTLSPSLPPSPFLPLCFSPSHLHDYPTLYFPSFLSSFFSHLISFFLNLFPHLSLSLLPPLFFLLTFDIFPLFNLFSPSLQLSFSPYTLSFLSIPPSFSLLRIYYPAHPKCVCIYIYIIYIQNSPLALY